MNQTKSIFKSKTHAFNVLIAILIGCQQFDTAAQWVQQNATIVAAGFYILSTLLRRATHGKVALFPEDEGGYKLPLIIGFSACFFLASCQPALIRINSEATPRFLVSAKKSASPAPVPADSQVINPAVYHKTSDADLVRALETLTPVR